MWKLWSNKSNIQCPINPVIEKKKKLIFNFNSIFLELNNLLFRRIKMKPIHRALFLQSKILENKRFIINFHFYFLGFNILILKKIKTTSIRHALYL